MKYQLVKLSNGEDIICKVEGDYYCYISCGVSDKAYFDRDFLNLYKNIEKNNLKCLIIN